MGLTARPQQSQVLFLPWDVAAINAWHAFTPYTIRH